MLVSISFSPEAKAKSGDLILAVAVAVRCLTLVNSEYEIYLHFAKDNTPLAFDRIWFERTIQNDVRKDFHS